MERDIAKQQAELIALKAEWVEAKHERERKAHRETKRALRGALSELRKVRRERSRLSEEVNALEMKALECDCDTVGTPSDGEVGHKLKIKPCGCAQCQ